MSITSSCEGVCMCGGVGGRYTLRVGGVAYLKHLLMCWCSLECGQSVQHYQLDVVVTLTHYQVNVALGCSLEVKGHPE